MLQILLFLGFHMTVPKIELGITDSSDFLLSRGITYAKPLYLSKCLVPKGLILRFAIEMFKDCPKKGPQTIAQRKQTRLYTGFHCNQDD